jgi:transcriptional regulator with XRE-family HTH domain
LTGTALRTLRLALGITQTSLARELGLTPQAVAGAEQVTRLKPATEASYTQAMARLARRASAERQRQATRELLELAD